MSASLILSIRHRWVLSLISLSLLAFPAIIHFVTLLSHKPSAPCLAISKAAEAFSPDGFLPLLGWNPNDCSLYVPNLPERVFLSFSIFSLDSEVYYFKYFPVATDAFLLYTLKWHLKSTGLTIVGLWLCSYIHYFSIRLLLILMTIIVLHAALFYPNLKKNLKLDGPIVSPSVSITITYSYICICSSKNGSYDVSVWSWTEPYLQSMKCPMD